MFRAVDFLRGARPFRLFALGDSGEGGFQVKSDAREMEEVVLLALLSGSKAAGGSSKLASNSFKEAVFASMTVEEAGVGR